MTQVPASPPSPPSGKCEQAAKPRHSLARFGVIFAACTLIVGAGAWIWNLRPMEPPTGRPIGTAGSVQAFAVPADPSGKTAGEGFTVWHNGRKTYQVPLVKAAGYERVELSSNDVDVAGNSAPDLVLYSWTGGAHCCFSQSLIDGSSGKFLGEFETGNADPLPFLPATAKNLARAVLMTYDDVTAFKFGAYVESPMARIAIIWNGKRFVLDDARMKAEMPGGPPAFFIGEPELADVSTLGVQDFGEDETVPSIAIDVAVDGAVRGDRANSYQTWMAGEEARMTVTPLVAGDPTSFGPMAAFLNERVYKGQAVSGVDTVKSTYGSTPVLRDEALAYYFSVLKQSRWYDDLNRLNGGQLDALASKLTSPLPTPTASP